MSEFLGFFELGFRHILDFAALDHVLFLLALAAVYRAADWREGLWVVSAFTIGHSITLALAVTDTVVANQRVVEFLIPLTIVATTVENIVVRDRARSVARHYRPLLAGVFGLVHGAGFAGYLKSMFMTDIALPLLGFNVGIEAGQLLALTVIALALMLVDAAIDRVRQFRRTPATVTVHRLRAIGLSIAIGLVGMVWTVERRPW